MIPGWPDPTRYGTQGAVCTVDQLATSAGVALLRAGGSAADAAVGASAVLAVTTQQSCGMGGDLVALVRAPGGEVRALLAAGRAGSGADAAQLRAAGHVRMPFRGAFQTVTVPGCVDGWLALHAAYGRLPLEQVLAAAASYALSGFAVSRQLSLALPSVADVPGAQELVGQALPRPGEVRRRPLLGEAIEAITREGREGWYGGAFGRALVARSEGVIAAQDLASSCAEWTGPVAVEVAGRRVLSTPAPTQGYLVAAGAVVAADLGALAADDDPHLLVEAARVVGHDRPGRLHDDVTSDRLMTGLRERAALVSPDRALGLPVRAEPGGTIYLCAADTDGMVVSLSQSNAAGFGAHLGIPEVGVLLHNRGIGFSLEPGHPAELRPGARPPHTLCPALVVDGDAVTAVGTMGGDAQPQIVLQLLAGLSAGLSPGEALARPRWSFVGPQETGFDAWEAWPDGGVAPAVSLEQHAPEAWHEALAQRGHVVQRAADGRWFGHAHVIARTADGRVAAASDPRAGAGDAQVV